MDLSAITATLAKMEAFTVDGWDDTTLGGRKHASDLERRLRQRDRELAAARARVAAIEAEAAAMQARLEQGEERETGAALAAPG